MRYAGMIKNDVAAAPGVCVTFFTQGCPHHCPGCHNPETWDFDGGREFTPKTLIELKKALIANGVHRDLCIMGGEPLCRENLFLVNDIIKYKRSYFYDIINWNDNYIIVSEKFDSSIKIYIWSGYTYEELLDRKEKILQNILENTDVLIDGPFILAERDITLPMRGSRNQRIIELKEKLK